MRDGFLVLVGAATVWTTMFLIGALSQPQRPHTVSKPAKAIAPVVVQEPKKPLIYTVEPPNPVQLPKGYPKDLQQQFHPNYQREQ